MLTLVRIAGLVGAPLLLFACGYTEEEMAAKQRRIDTLTAQVQALRVQAPRTSTPACAARDKIPSTPPPRKGGAVATR